MDVYVQDEQTVVGALPPILSHLLEIAGLGMFDVLNLFGLGAVCEDTTIRLIGYLENWTPDKTSDRLGSGEQTQMIFDGSVSKITISV